MNGQVVPLHVANVWFPPGHPQEGDRGPVLAFAVRHADGVLLFDTGVGFGEPEIDRWFRPERTRVEDALAAHGIARTAVVAVANSHLHFDHCGQNEAFADVPIHVQEAERRAATAPDYTVPGWVEFPGARYEQLDGEAEVLPGVRLVPTPGHTPGHQSLVVETDEGRVVVAGQAAYTRDEWEGSEDRRRSGRSSAWDPERYDESVRRLRGLYPSRVLFSHDSREWRLE